MLEGFKSISNQHDSDAIISYNLSRQLKAVTRGGADLKPERVRTADAKLPKPKLLSFTPQ